MAQLLECLPCFQGVDTFFCSNSRSSSKSSTGKEDLQGDAKTVNRKVDVCMRISLPSTTCSSTSPSPRASFDYDSETSMQLETTCPKGHQLVDLIVPARGICDGCCSIVECGQHVMDCRACDWFLCDACSATSNNEIPLDTATSNNEIPLDTDIVEFSESPCGLGCPKGHRLFDLVTPAAGVCDGCFEKIECGQHVMDCRSCDWFLCKACSALPQYEVSLKNDFYSGWSIDDYDIRGPAVEPIDEVAIARQELAMLETQAYHLRATVARRRSLGDSSCEGDDVSSIVAHYESVLYGMEQQMSKLSHDIPLSCTSA